MAILFNDPSAYFKKEKKVFNKILDNVVDSGSYILSNEVSKFEERVNKFISNKKGHFVSCANGTDAIILSLKALGLSNGQKILVPSHTAPATIAAILSANCIPYFIDVNLNLPLINFKNIKNLLKRNKFAAIIIVHLYGYPLDVKKIKPLFKKHKIKIIEDCAQSFGASINGDYTGTLADSGCFSFFPTKNLNTIGDGGGIWVPNLNLKKKILSLRQYGWDSKRIVKIEGGINSRLDSLHASFLTHRLKKIKEEIKIRNKIARRYKKNLHRYFKIFEEDKNTISSYHLFVVRVKNRDGLIDFMKKNKVILGIHYYPACHNNGIFKKYIKIKLANTDLLSREVVSLPMYPELKFKDQNYVIHKLNEFAISQI